MASNKELAKKEINGIEVYAGSPFAIMNMDVEVLPQLLEDNIGEGNNIEESDLDRVHVPGGGGIAWEVPDLNGEPESVKELVGVILLHGDRRAYWETSFDESGGGSPPDCSSFDARVGVGYIRNQEKVPEGESLPVRACKTCPMSQWGSADLDDEKNNSQACNARKILYFMREDDVLPMIVDLPPTSLKALRQFMLRLTSKGVPCHGAIVGLSLRKEQSSGGITYSSVVPKLISRLEENDCEAMGIIAKAMKPFFDRTGMADQDVKQTPTVDGQPIDPDPADPVGQDPAQV